MSENTQLYSQDPSVDLLYLRATSYIHKALQKNPKAKFRTEALYALGSAYDSLQDPLLWPLVNSFFEMCVHEKPHSTIARKCYDRYAAKLALAYSEGGEGSFLPDDEVAKLVKLREESRP